MIAIMVGGMAIAALAVLAVLLVRNRPGVSQAVTQASPPSPPTPIPTESPIGATPAVEPASTLAPTSTEAASGEETVPPAEPPTATPLLILEPTALPTGILLEHTGDGPGTASKVNLPPGVYRVLFRADSSFGSLKPVADEGGCGEIPIFANMPGPFEGSATYRSMGCNVQFEVSDTSGSWTIAVEAAAEGGLLTVPTTISGDRPEATGLVDLPEGAYRLALKTNSAYSMVVPIVASGQCLERPVFLLTQPGYFETTYSSTGCQIVFQISSVTASWELAILPGG